MALLQQPNYKHRGTSSSHGYSDETRTKKTNDTLNTDMEWMKIVVISLFLCVISVLCVSSDMVDLSVSADDDTQEVDSCLSQLQHNLYWPHNLSSPYWDATGHVAGGLLQGNLVWLGRYDDCQGFSNGLYCLADLQVTPPLRQLNVSSVHVLWGICASKACNNTILEQNIQDIFRGTFGSELNDTEIQSSIVHCSKKSIKSKGFYITLVLCIFLVALCVLGTVVDLYHRFKVTHHPSLVHCIDESGAHLISAQVPPDATIQDEATGHVWERPPNREQLLRAFRINPGPVTRFFRCFSVAHNLESLFSSKQTAMPCLDGLRVLSILWIMLGHTYLGAFASALMDNPLDALATTHHIAWQFVGNAYFAVDTFFLLSGLLVAYLTLPVLSSREGKFPVFKFYLYRYFRLTPAVGLIMLLWVYLLPHWGSAPLWYQLQDDPTCLQYWWSNLLYIQNFYPTSLEHICIGWVWYLAIDMQFYILSPIILYLFYRSWRGGLITAVVLCILSLLVTMVLIGYYQIDVNLTHSVVSGDLHASEQFESMIYGKPYCRVVPYLVGISLGYLLYAENNIKRRITRVLVWLGWLAAGGSMVALVWGLYGTFWGHKLTLVENMLYGSLSHTVWALALAWLIYACHHGYAGVVNDFLSWSWWRPLSRLTFAVYMVHPLVMFSYNLGQQTTFHMDTYHMMMRYSGYVLLSLLASLGLHVFLEKPALALMNLCLANPHH